MEERLFGVIICSHISQQKMHIQTIGRLLKKFYNVKLPFPECKCSPVAGAST